MKSMCTPFGEECIPDVLSPDSSAKNIIAYSHFYRNTVLCITSLMTCVHTSNTFLCYKMHKTSPMAYVWPTGEPSP